MDPWRKPSFLNDPEDYLSTNTDQILQSYPNAFQLVESEDKKTKYYIEIKEPNKPTTRDRRSIATKQTPTIQGEDGVQDFIFLKGENIWEMVFTQDDLSRISRTLEEIKFRIEKEDSLDFESHVTLNNGLEITIDWMSYIPDNIAYILEQLDIAH